MGALKPWANKIVGFILLTIATLGPVACSSPERQDFTPKQADCSHASNNAGEEESGPVSHSLLRIRGSLTQPPVIYFSIVEPPARSYSHPSLNKQSFRQAILKSMKLYQQHIDIQFIETQTSPAQLANGAVYVEFSMTPRRHANCPSFKSHERGKAHTGPMRSHTFVHFNQMTNWVKQSEDEDPLLSTALHEIGHLLGLAHSFHPESIMYARYNPKHFNLHASDILSLQSLYGGGRKHPNDLLVCRFGPGGEPQTKCILRQIVNIDEQEFMLLRVGKENSDQLIVWPKENSARINTIGWGLIAYKFTQAGKLQSSTGPIGGIFVPGQRTEIIKNKAGLNFLIRNNGNRYAAYPIPADWKLLAPFPRDRKLELQDGRADLNGDQIWDQAPAQQGLNLLQTPSLRNWLSKRANWQHIANADINGDSLPEHLVKSGFEHRWLISSQAGIQELPIFCAKRLSLGQIGKDKAPWAVIQF